MTEKKQPKKPAAKKTPTPKVKEDSKVTFPYSQFPVLVIHKDGKDLQDTKKCYFQNTNHAEKYIARCNFKQKDYQLHVKPGTDVENMVQSPRGKARKKQ